MMSPTVKMSLKHSKKNMIFLDSSDDTNEEGYSKPAPSFELSHDNILANIT